MAATALTEALAGAGVSFELIPHRHTETAAEEAEVLGVPPAEVAKTLVVTSPEGYIRAVLPASERLDLHKVRALLGGTASAIHLATEGDIARDYPEFELGAVPPVGGARSDRVLVDRRLAEGEWLVFEAGSHEESVRVRTADLLGLTQAQLADICEE